MSVALFKVVTLLKKVVGKDELLQEMTIIANILYFVRRKEKECNGTTCVSIFRIMSFQYLLLITMIMFMKCGMKKIASY